MPLLTTASRSAPPLVSSDLAAPSTDLAARIASRFFGFQLSRAATIFISVLLTLIAASGDAMTSAETTFTLFYVMALAVGTWFGGIGVGYLVAVVAVVGAAGADMMATPAAPSAWFLVWNTLVDFTLYVVFSHMLSALRNRLAKEVSARQDAVGQLRHAERLTTIGKLASGIAHEIGTPLNVISGRAELIASGTLSSEAVASSANIVLEQTERVAVIIRQLLDFARRAGAHAERTNLTDLVETTALLLRPLAARGNVEVVCTGEPCEAQVNRSEMQQVITNLLTNAIHATSGPGRIEIETGYERRRAPTRDQSDLHSYAVIRIQDHGAGIDPDILPKIFDPFFTTKDVGRGTGLGLSVAYGIVHDHRGWIMVDSKPGLGTTVKVYLPQ